MGPIWRRRDRWPDQALALIAVETVAKAAERCEVAYTTAFRWRHRFLSALNLVLPRLNAASITAALGQVITRPAELCCDGGAAITAFARRARVKVHVLPAPDTPKPEAPDLHINNVNAYHGR
jgi:hypothetical protein